MKMLRPILLPFPLLLLLVSPGSSKGPAERPATTAKPRPVTKSGLTAAADKATRDALAQFARGDPGWKVRMEALVGLARLGPAAVPLLVEALQKGSPATREFAAQALVVLTDPRARPALEQALDDPQPRVHIYALKALNMLGRIELSKPQRERLKKNAPYWMREYVDFVADRDETPSPRAMREALLGYDLATMDSARVGGVAPDFALADGSGTIHRLSRFRGQKVVILEFNDGDG
jgi:hypothetical protein